MITITSVEVAANPYTYSPEMKFEGVINLELAGIAKEGDIPDDEWALMIGREFMKHLMFVSKITDGDS